MNPEFLTRIFQTAGGLTVLVVTGLGTYFSWFKDLATWLAPHIERFTSASIASWLAPAIALGLPAILFAVSLAITVRAFRKRSRLMVPKAFNLDRSRRDQLYGREEVIEKLIEIVEDNSLVFLTGESGVGKSALLRAGLLPELQKRNKVCPIYFANFGTDWVNHPSKNLYAAIRAVLSAEQIVELGLPAIVNPIDITPVHVAALLDKIPAKLGKVPLIFFDQFDDYQLRFREYFVTGRGTWTSSRDVQSQNPFWDTIGSRLASGTMKAVFVARADTASGLISVQFCRPESYPLGRPRSDVLTPLLDDLAPASANPIVVRDPENGWEQLKLVLVEELEQNGTILPQEIRIVLQGLRRLKYLTPTAYGWSGRVNGIKANFVASTVASVAATLKVTDEVVLDILACLVVPGASESAGDKTIGKSADQIAKLLAQPAVTSAIVESILKALESEEMVRPRTDSGAGSVLWQLDHDYLAAPVLEVKHRRKRWGSRLEHGDAAWTRTHGIVGSWRALLSPLEQLAILIERLRGRLQYGRSRAYALTSLLKFIPSIVVIGAFGIAYVMLARHFAISAEAAEIVAGIGEGDDQPSKEEAKSLLSLARSKLSVKERVFHDLLATEGGRKRAARRAITLIIAVAGLDQAQRAKLAKQVLEPSNQSVAYIDSMASLAGLFKATDPNPQQISEFVNFAATAIAADASKSYASRALCEHTKKMARDLKDVDGAAQTSSVGDLLKSLEAVQDDESKSFLAGCLLGLLENLAPTIAPDSVESTISRLEKFDPQSQNESLSAAWLAAIKGLVSQLDTKDQATLFHNSAKEVADAPHSIDAKNAARLLAAFADQLDATSADNLWKSTRTRLEHPTTDEDTQTTFIRLISYIAPHLGPDVSLEAWKFAIERSANSSTSEIQEEWAIALEALSTQLSGPDLSPALTTWLGAIQEGGNIGQYPEGKSGGITKAFADRLDDDSKRAMAAEAAKVLLSTKQSEGDRFHAAFILTRICDFTVALDEAERTATVDWAIETLQGRPTYRDHYTLLELLKAAAPSMTPQQADSLVSYMIKRPMDVLLGKGIPEFVLETGPLVGVQNEILTALIPKLPQETIDKLSSEVLEGMVLYYSEGSRSLYFLTEIAYSISLETLPKLVSHLASASARAKLELLAANQKSLENRALSAVVRALAADLNKSDAQAIVVQAKKALKSDLSSGSSRFWMDAIAGLAARLGASDSEELIGVIREMAAKERADIQHNRLADYYRALASLTTRVGPDSSRAVGKEAVEALFITSNLEAFREFMRCVLLLHDASPDVIEPTEAARIVAHPWSHFDDSPGLLLLGDRTDEANDEMMWKSVDLWMTEHQVDARAAQP